MDHWAHVVDIAERLGYAETRDIRPLIKDHLSEIEQFGCARRCTAHMDVAMPRGDVKRIDVEHSG